MLRRGELVNELLSEAAWLDLGEFESLCRRSDDALDAVVAALTAGAAAWGRTESVPASLQSTARAEGWVAIPQKGATLSELGVAAPIAP